MIPATTSSERAVGVSCRGGTRKMTSPIWAMLCVGDTSDAKPAFIRYYSVANTESVKKTTPAYMIPTNRELFDRLDSASIVDVASTTCTNA